MSEKFQGKYRVSSTRLQNWDYGSNGAYFITICTKNREHYFGEIIRKISGPNQDNAPKMQLSQMGRMARKFWFEIPFRFPYIKLNAFVVMPNHVHGIIVIEKPGDDADGDGGNGDAVIGDGAIGDDAIGGGANGDGANGGNCRDAINRVSTTTNDKTPGGITNKKNPMLHDNISRIIRWYKGRVAFESRKLNSGFAWQPRFHDHIIRNKESFLRIKNYIETNPMNWHKDVFCNKTQY